MDDLIEAITQTWQAIGHDVDGVELNIHAIEICLDCGGWEMYGRPTQTAKDTLKDLIATYGWTDACRRIDQAMTWKLV
jgi:hypothetical protein